MSDWNLSEERVFYPEGFFYKEKDVKEFIKLLKESFGKGSHNYFSHLAIKKHINKLAGEELI